jgi:flavin reductase (DIM6/NTAB) family NADH-FMN oxidoreductase RutF/DNA-binding GntR family transcriptional regulator
MMTTAKPETTGLVDRNLFRDVMGRFASGVTVITTRSGGADSGTTASAVSSLSLDPPMVLVCLNMTSSTQAAVRDAGCFAVNILGADQSDLAYQFATKSGAAKFEGAEILRGERDVPLLAGALAHIQCRVAETVVGGTHTVFLGEVDHAAASEGAPLTYFRGTFGRFETELEEAAYRELRRLILDRAIPSGAPVDVDELAVRMNVSAPRVFYALTKLSADGLVARDAATGYRINPLTVFASDQAYDARCTVEIGVAEQTVPTATDEDLEEMRAHVEATAQTVIGPEPTLAAFQRENGAFHEHQFSLSRNHALVEFYRRLGISAISTRALEGHDWQHMVQIDDHAALLQAYRDRDVEAAKEVIHRHNDHAKQVAQEVIEAAGGEM